jgi:hypothetical protein
MAPRVPGFREAMTKKDNWSFSLLGYMDAESIRFNVAMFKIEHRAHLALNYSRSGPSPKNAYLRNTR